LIDLDRILENLLQPDSMAFKKSIGQIPKFNNNNIDFNTNSFGFHHSDTFGMNMENIYEENNDYYSSTSREPLRTVVKQRHYSDHDTTKKKKKIKDSGIESQALRNLRKELEKMGDMEDEKDLKPKQKLNDWINRRVTGYLIFQNSMNASNKEKGISDTGVHLNSSMGKKWKGLNEREKKDYKDLANHYRSVFKREIEEHDSEKAKDLIEMLDEKIKKVKLV